MDQVYNFNGYFQQEMFSEINIFITKTIQDHVKMLEYVKKTFIDKYGTFRKDLLSKIILRSRVNKKTNFTNFRLQRKN